MWFQAVDGVVTRSEMWYGACSTRECVSADFVLLFSLLPALVHPSLNAKISCVSFSIANFLLALETSCTVDVP